MKEIRVQHHDPFARMPDPKPRCTPPADDPAYLDFVNADELHGIEGAALLALGRPDRAAAAYRTAVEQADRSYQRNLVTRTAQLAEALRQQGDFTGASETALSVVSSVATLKSRRTRERFAKLRTNLGEVTLRVPRARDFTARYDSAMAGRRSGTGTQSLT